MINLTDYELVSNYKVTDNQEYICVLYERYLPIIKKFASNVSFGGKDRERKNDFIQDSYLDVKKCVDSVVLKKIPNSIINNWNFYSRYKYYLKNRSIAYRKKSIKSCYTTYDELELDNCKYIDNVYDNSFVYNQVEQILSQTTRFQDFEKKLFFEKLQGKTYKDLRLQYKISSPDHHFKKILEFIKQKLSYFYTVDDLRGLYE